MPTEEQLTEYKEAFSLFDKKGDSTIDPAAVGDLLRSLGKNPTMAQLKEISTGLPNPVSFDFFVNEVMAKEFAPSGTLDDFLQGFQVFDKDGNGFISSGELRYVLTSLGEKLTDAEVDELLKSVEVNKQGYVNYEQFVKTILAG